MLLVYQPLLVVHWPVVNKCLKKIRDIAAVLFNFRQIYKDQIQLNCTANVLNF